MLYIDAKYVNILGTRLRNFKQKKDYVWNFSCPLCGDSTSNKSRARGYIYRQKSDLFYKCHKCAAGTNLGNVIKHVDPLLYKEYVVERYKEGATRYNSHKDVGQFFQDTKPAPTPTELLEDDVLQSLERIDKMDPTHYAVEYVRGRLIPEVYWKYLYFTPTFKKYVNTFTKKFSNEENDHPRLIIPFFTNAGKCFAFQGRAFGDEQPKYMTIKVDDNEEKVYGLDRVDYSKRIYVVEGPIDSLFLPNAIAVSGSTFDTPTVRGLLTNATIVMDNEPRSKELVKILAKNIDAGYNVCMFPETVREKDINEMIKSGKSIDDILTIINTNTFSGIQAKLKFSQWRKC